jgi:predicted transposase/invertase (TIGR01784 family)
MTKALAPIGRGRYAFLLFDSTFKVVICNPENENLLIQILELLIPGKKISQIIFSDKEKHGLVISEKRVNFDLLCKDAKTGEEFLVEVQNAPQNSFRDRALSYSTYPIREQLAGRMARIRDGEKMSKMDYGLKPVYVISLLNFTLKHDSEDALEDGYICRYELRNRHNTELMTPSLNFVFVELGRLKLKEDEGEKCRDLLEKFIFSLKYMHMLTEPPKGFTDGLLNDLYRATELATMPIETREYYNQSMRTELDIIAERDFAKEVAMAEGRAEGWEEGLEAGRAEGLEAGRAEGLEAGRAEGLEAGRAEVAKAMLAQGLAPELVAACSGFTVEELKAL